jgi:hypothetical protein
MVQRNYKKYNESTTSEAIYKIKMADETCVLNLQGNQHTMYFPWTLIQTNLSNPEVEGKRCLLLYFHKMKLLLWQISK